MKNNVAYIVFMFHVHAFSIHHNLYKAYNFTYQTEAENVISLLFSMINDC